MATNHWISLPATEAEAGSATAANQVIEIGLLTDIDNKLTSPITVTGDWLTDAELRASPVPVLAAQSGVWSVNASQSGTWNINNISGTINLPTGASTSALQSTGNTSLASIDSKLTSPLIVSQATAANLNATVTPIPITKGTQGSTGFTVQALKDAGRTSICFSNTTLQTAAATGVVAALTLAKASGTSAPVSGTSFVITAGKTFRITSILVMSRGNTTATVQNTVFAFRTEAAGPVTTSSNIFLNARSATTATASMWDQQSIPVPDGLEIYGDGLLQFGVTAVSGYTTNAPLCGVTIIGYEY